jgi:hypothetical protein
VKTWIKIILVLPLVAVLVIGGWFVWNTFVVKKSILRVMSGLPFVSQPIDGLTANLFTSGGQLRSEGNDLFIEFRDARRARVDVGTVKFELDLAMPGLVLHSAAKIQPTRTPGQYRALLTPELAGDWRAKLSYSGPRGQAETTFTLSVK